MELEQVLSYYALGFVGGEGPASCDSSSTSCAVDAANPQKRRPGQNGGAAAGRIKRGRRDASSSENGGGGAAVGATTGTTAAATTGWKDDVGGNMHLEAPAMESHVRALLEEGAAKNWHRFYQRNADKFYKDRHYLHHAFPGIISTAAATTNAATGAGAAASTDGAREGAVHAAVAAAAPTAATAATMPTTLIGFGCGVGNALFPLAELDPALSVVGLDFAAEAIAIFRQHPAYDGRRIRAFVQDLVNDPIVPEVASELAGRTDKVLCLFCLSAVHPSNMRTVVAKAFALLRPGGRFFFRDYCRGDHAQVRFGTAKKIEDNFYLRQDGTRAYFFTADELRRLLGGCGFEEESVGFEERAMENKKEHKVWQRRWVQAVFRKPLLQLQPPPQQQRHQPAGVVAQGQAGSSQAPR